ncbi:hypothetical protein C0J52_17723 [Blattella germanica]|nr:hypothetical protein C0J52_17723 [Blattella germanica]
MKMVSLKVCVFFIIALSIFEICVAEEEAGRTVNHHKLPTLSLPTLLNPSIKSKARFMPSHTTSSCVCQRCWRGK